MGTLHDQRKHDWQFLGYTVEAASPEERNYVTGTVRDLEEKLEKMQGDVEGMRAFLVNSRITERTEVWLVPNEGIVTEVSFSQQGWRKPRITSADFDSVSFTLRRVPYVLFYTPEDYLGKKQLVDKEDKEEVK